MPLGALDPESGIEFRSRLSDFSGFVTPFRRHCKNVMLQSRACAKPTAPIQGPGYEKAELLMMALCG